VPRFQVRRHSGVSLTYWSIQIPNRKELHLILSSLWYNTVGHLRNHGCFFVESSPDDIRSAVSVLETLGTVIALLKHPRMNVQRAAYETLLALFRHSGLTFVRLFIRMLMVNGFQTTFASRCQSQKSSKCSSGCWVTHGPMFNTKHSIFYCTTVGLSTFVS
jgi:hypothetical protein